MEYQNENEKKNPVNFISQGRPALLVPFSEIHR